LALAAAPAFSRAAVAAPSPAPQSEQFLRNLALGAAETSVSDEKLRQEYLSAIKKALVRPVAGGIYEVDFNREDRAKFLNPDLAASQDGQILLFYTRLITEGTLLQTADVFMRRDADGRMRFYQNGSELSTFDAFSKLAVEDFLNGFSPALSSAERLAFRLAAEAKRLVPTALKEDAGSWTIKAFDARTGAAVSLPLTNPGFPEVLQALKGLKKPS
jgi:hypothetical protein